MTDFQIVIFSFILFLLILFAAFFACAETALMAVNRYRLRHRAHLQKRYAIRLIKLLKRPDRLLGAILIGSTFTNILASSLATLIAFHYFGEQGAFFAAIILTFIILVFAEITPKTLAAIYADQVARWVVMPIYIFLKLFYPIVWLANAVTNGFLRMLNIRIANNMTPPLTREELRSIVYDTQGTISRQYQNMLLGILDLNKLTVDDVMIPRHEVTGIDIEMNLEAITETIKNVYFDWLPVYRETVNQVIGVLYTRDLVRLLLTQPLSKENITNHIQPPYFIPQRTSLYAQLNYFHQTQNKIAFVVDEYGEVLGVLTLNDIFEEIVGDFNSHVSQKRRIIQQEDGSYLVSGSLQIRDFNRETGWFLPLTGPRTINGLIVEYLESLPHSGTAMLIDSYPIEIMQVKENRVRLARIFPKRLPDATLN